MNKRHEKILRSVFAVPTSGAIPWRDIESLFSHLGAEISEGRGSRVRVILNDVYAVFHRPHPEKEACKGAVEAVRDFLTKAGVKP